MAVKLADVARDLGLSKATVSLALSGSDLVNDGTRERVIQAAQRMGYVPNVAARRLVQRTNNTLGLIVPDLANPYFGTLAQQLDLDARRRGYRLMIAPSNEDFAAEQQSVDEFIANRVGGVLIAPTNHAMAQVEYLEKLSRYDIPCLYVSSCYPGIAAPCVMTDLERGSHALIDYLLDLGHENIYLLGADPAMVPTLHRTRGYRRAFAGRGITVAEHRFIDCGATTFERAYATTLRLLDEAPGISAMVCINDIMALGVLRALLDRGIDVPGQVSVAGFDDVVFASVSAIPITTVRQDIAALARLSVDTLLALPQQGGPASATLVEPQLIVRHSTGKYHPR